MNSRSLPMAWRWLTKMILPTPRSRSRSISAWTAAAVVAKSGVTATFRGTERFRRAGVVAPTMPKRAPVAPSVTIIERATTRPSSGWPSIRPSASTRSSNPGSAEKSRLALRNGWASKARTNRSKRSGPESNSWLPMTWAS